MKKIIIITVVILIIIIVPFMMYVANYKQAQNEIKKFNLMYEKYKDKTIYGAEVGSIINYAIDNNEKYKIEKHNNKYIDDDKYYIQILIQLKEKTQDGEEEKTSYDMETIKSLGVDRFVKNFNLIEFDCTEITYNSIGRVRRVIFEIHS